MVVDMSASEHRGVLVDADGREHRAVAEPTRSLRPRLLAARLPVNPVVHDRVARVNSGPELPMSLRKPSSVG